MAAPKEAPLQPGWTSCRPRLQNGIDLHYVVAEPPDSFGRPLATLVLVHGWPDCWFGWRRQLAPLAAAGFRAIAVDCRGYGGSSAPSEDAAYAHELLCGDMARLLDHLEVRAAIFIGHDWGGTLVWNMALAFPERVCAVAAVCTPFMPPPKADPWEQMQKKAPGSRFDYQMYFQSRRSVEELDEDPSRSFRAIFRSPARLAEGADLAKLKVPPTKREPQPGFINHFPRGGDVLRDSAVLADQSELEYYVAQNRRCGGFHGGLRWYRNVQANWHFAHEALRRRGLTESRIDHEALMITAGRDHVLTPEMVDKYMVPFVPRLTRGHVEGAGHWVLQETSLGEVADGRRIPHHEQVSNLLLDWLRSPKILAATNSGLVAKL
mmetsp:Transcript_160502/g.515204  ORF Transcript_160502/g.515204 Transcript_160502/m.515204 type:complete len:378 (-) Transcript_160502:73-1206(-)